MRIERQADKAQAGDDEFRLFGIAKTENAAPAAVRRDGVEHSLDIEGKTLGTAEPGEKAIHGATGRNAIDRIEARCGRSCDIKIVIEAEREMIGGDAGLERRE